MRFELEHFTSAERRKARERLKLLMNSGDFEKAKYKDIYWFLPLLNRLWDKVDELLDEEPKIALEIAECLPTVAERIRVENGGMAYRDEAERNDFVAFSRAIFASALLKNGKVDKAGSEITTALDLVKKGSTDPVARAEVLRRAAYIALETANFEAASRFSERAAEGFLKHELYDRLALALLYKGQAKNLLAKPGVGTEDFAQALYFGAKDGSDRGRRAVVAAASCLARDAVLAHHFPSEAAKWASAAREAMKGKPNSIAKIKISWVEALAAHRRRLGPYAISRLLSVRKQLLALGALGDAVCCTADLLEVVREHEPERLTNRIEESAELLKAATPESAQALLETWLEQPSEVTALRKLQAKISRQE